MGKRKRPNIVSLFLSSEARAALDKARFDRGMTIKSLLGRLISWFVTLDRTEQAIVLGQLDEADVPGVAEMLRRRVARRRARKRRRGARAAGRG